MKKLIPVLIVIVIVGLLAIPKIKPLFQADTQGGAPGMGGPGGGALLPVEATIVTPAPYERKLVVTGSILPSESIELKSEVSGKISGIYFQESQPVRKGQRLLKIDDDELVAQLEKQKYNKKLFEDNEYRQRKLLEKEAISQEEYDNALNRLRTTAADIKVLEAQIAETEVIAPFDGYIGFRYVSPGAYISPATVIATVYSLDPAKIEFSVPARYASRVYIGSPIVFRQENDPDLSFKGEVYAIEPQIDPTTRTLKIRSKTPNTDGKLIPGQFVSIELILEHLDSALLVPTQAVIPVQDGAKVYVASNGKAKEVMVTAGDRTESKLEILSGLQPGDTVITSGILQLRQGMGIQITRIE
ncbi:MAG: efflux RND transporter periplasmic adaptor subunit [Cyclobacteriaceae bacterium]|jgi:membrane fusion protein (multidrug efflux system)